MNRVRKFIDYALSSEDLPPEFTFWCLGIVIVAIAVLAGGFQ